MSDDGFDINNYLMWRTRDGRFMRVEEMETSHIQRCIANIMIRGGSWRGEHLISLVNELEKRERA